MGEVYKATDTRLGRTVAIKVLPEHVASDEGLKTRFEREARALSSLNHPHICTIHDIGRHEGIDFLVMEHLEGETLAERLAKGPLPVAQALDCAMAIADALDKAHRQGIVHRDLKPGNIMLTKTGPKLLDFGLAKLHPIGLSGSIVVSAAQTVPAPLTGSGTILGTFEYMSPEQLEGREADARSDIFAFGTVVYEMATGHRAFEGKSQASLIHAIMGTEPRPVSTVQPLAPRALDHLIGRCLAKAPEDRWQTARDVHQELRWVMEQSSTVTGASAAQAASTHPWRTALPIAVASLVLGAGITAIMLRFGTTLPAPPMVTRLQAAFTPARSIGNPRLPQVAISPDGSTLAFAGQLPNGSIGIFVRPLGAEEATMVATNDTVAFGPVFSPDGAWLVYRSLQELFKVPVAGGRPTTLGRLESVFDFQGLSWSADDWIYYTKGTSAAAGGLLRIRASGGPPEQLTSSTEGGLEWPHALGDGRFVIFSESQATGERIKLLDTQTKETRVLLDAGGSVPSVTASGHLLFARNGSLFAVPFDVDRKVVAGTPRDVLSGVQYEPSSTAAQYAIARNGTLVYLSGASPGTSLMWADTRGALLAFPQKRTYYDPRLSPDGRAVAVEVLEDGDDIWVLDLTRGTQTKLSLGANEDETPAWSPDGRWVAWSASRDAKRVILRKRADGSGPEETVWSGPEHVHVIAYTPDGKSLLFEKQTLNQNTDVMLLTLDGSGTDRLVVGSPFNEVGARLSPDGRWLAYMSDESGIPQIYVQPFPALDARFLISPSGGAEPVWSRDGRRLFYRVNSATWSVSIAPGQAFKASIPERLVESRGYQNKAVTHTGYDVAPDGRFLVIGDTSPQAAEVLNVIQGWFTELNRLVPTSR
jgi:serine/threonine-protein kinase